MIEIITYTREEVLFSSAFVCLSADWWENSSELLDSFHKVQ